MAKNKNAKTAKKDDVKPVAQATPTTETKKDASTEAQVAAETVTTPKEEVNKEEKKATAKPKKEKTPTLVPEEVTEPKKKIPNVANVAVGSQASSFDGKAQLAFVMQQRYMNAEVQKNCPELFEAMGHNIDVVVVLALNDLQNEIAARAESGSLKLTVSPDQVLQLNEAASMLGIELAPAKALPGATNGQMVIDFNEAKIPEELKKTAAVEKHEVELDPKKVNTTDMLIEALEHLMTANKKNPAENIANTIAWYRNYCINQEENADKKLKLDDRTVGDWLDEIHNLIKPTIALNGIGGACYIYTSMTKSPVMAHCILHNHFSKLDWNEEEIAELVKCFTKGKYKLKVQQDGLKETPSENKALNAISGKLGLEYIDKVFENLNSRDKEERNESLKILGLIRTNYFPKDKAEVPTTDELRMKLGQIINLYRDPMDRLETFAQAVSESKTSEKEEVTEKKN